jgi:hypothetical protein
MPRIRSDQKQHRSLTNPNVELSQKMTGAAGHSKAWDGVAREQGTAQDGGTRYGTVYHVTERHGTTRHDMARDDAA